MQNFLWLLICIIAYAAGLILITRMTALLPRHSFDEMVFTAWAALDIVGALLAFGGIVVPIFMFNGNFGARGLDFILLIVLFLLTARLALRALRPYHVSGTFRVSRIIAGMFSLLLAAAAATYIVLLFVVR